MFNHFLDKMLHNTPKYPKYHSQNDKVQAKENEARLSGSGLITWLGIYVVHSLMGESHICPAVKLSSFIHLSCCNRGAAEHCQTFGYSCDNMLRYLNALLCKTVLNLWGFRRLQIKWLGWPNYLLFILSIWQNIKKSVFTEFNLIAIKKKKNNKYIAFSFLLLQTIHNGPLIILNFQNLDFKLKIIILI